MKTTFLTSAMILLAVGAASAQQAPLAASAPDVERIDTTFIIERYTPEPAPRRLLTAADSAQERARLANARFLREQPTRPARRLPTNVPLTGSEPATAASDVHPTAAQPVSAAELEARAAARRAQTHSMIAQSQTRGGRKQLTKAARTNAELRAADARAAERPARERKQKKSPPKS